MSVDALQANTTILKGGISPDHKDSVIFNYNRTNSIFLRTLKDELRRVSTLTLANLVSIPALADVIIQQTESACLMICLNSGAKGSLTDSFELPTELEIACPYDALDKAGNGHAGGPTYLAWQGLGRKPN